MMAGSAVLQTGFGRVFLQFLGANPGNPLEYQYMARMGGFTAPQGDITRVQIPSATAYDEFDSVDEVRGESGVVTTSINARFGLDNPLLQARCVFQAQVHYGKC